MSQKKDEHIQKRRSTYTEMEGKPASQQHLPILPERVPVVPGKRVTREKIYLGRQQKRNNVSSKWLPTKVEQQVQYYKLDQTSNTSSTDKPHETGPP